MSSTLRVQLGRIGRRKWIVLAIVMAFLLGGATSISTQQTTYSSKAALVVVSQNRAPEQDAILAQGYANFFNDPVYQGTLRQRAGVSSDVTFEAETAGASPLIYITASSPNEASVRSAASGMALALRATVNDAIRASRDDVIATLRHSLSPDAAGNDIPEQVLIQMEDRITNLNADNTNQLEVIQLESKIGSSSPDSARAMGLALFAGIVMGCAVALAMGSLTTRVDSKFELEERCHAPVLAIVPRRGPARQALRLRQLALALKRPEAQGHSVLAVSSVVGTGSPSGVAWAIASYRADQGEKVLIVDADLSAPGDSPGLAEYLLSSDGAELSAFLYQSPQHTCLSQLGRGIATGEVRALSLEQVGRISAESRDWADVVIIVAPRITERADAQVVCAASDSILLVADQHVTKIGGVREAKRLIEQVDGQLAGVVLVERGVDLSAPLPFGKEDGRTDRRAPTKPSPATVGADDSTTDRTAEIHTPDTQGQGADESGDIAERRNADAGDPAADATEEADTPAVSTSIPTLRRRSLTI